MSGYRGRALGALIGLLLCVPLAPAAVAAPRAEICNRHCDGRDPSLATGDRIPVSADASGRTVELHVDDGGAMGWASVSGADEGDQVWLDRSFDGGKTWGSGARLGDSTVPAGRTGWRTLMFNADDWNARGVGALRACTAPPGGPAACTGWARPDWNAGTRSTAAATALMMRYRQDIGLFDTGNWWTSANALTALIDNIRVSGMRGYEYAIAHTYDLNVDAQGGDFTNEYLDDTGWWGLAWIAAYDLTGDGRYLETARADADHMAAHWTPDCGGGVLWNQHETYKNAITNELYVHLNAALHNRIPGEATYLQRARDGWAWFDASGMINSDGLVNDGITEGCANNGDTTWTYNQGVLLGGLVELHRATGEQALLDRARALADASTGSEYLNPGGVLREPVEADDCFGDGASFKGPYVRGLGVLDAALDDRPYTDYLARQAEAAHANDRDSLDAYGPHWNGPYVAPGDGHGCQHSALDLLNAAVRD